MNSLIEHLQSGVSESEWRAVCDALHDLMPEPKCVQPPNYLKSIDAAMKLVPDGWHRQMRDADRDQDETGTLWILESPDYESVIWGKGENWITDELSGSRSIVWHNEPAIGLCIAALKARNTI